MKYEDAKAVLEALVQYSDLGIEALATVLEMNDHLNHQLTCVQASCTNLLISKRAEVHRCNEAIADLSILRDKLRALAR